MLLVSLLFSLDDDDPPSFDFDFGCDFPLALVSTLDDGELLTTGTCCLCLAAAAIICPSNEIALELLIDLCCDEVMERDNNGSRRKLCILLCTARGGVVIIVGGRESMPSVVDRRFLDGDDKLLYFVNVSLLFSFVLLCDELFLLLVAAVTVVEVILC